MRKVQRWLHDTAVRALGSYVAIDRKARVLRSPRTIGLFAREVREIRQLRRTLPQQPSARVVTIVPTYRRPDDLTAAVRSALAQTVTDHVVVVVDDGGGQLAALDHPRLVQVSLTQNCGVAGVVRNVGIKLSRAEFFAFLDDDNTWSSGHLTAALEALEGGATLSYSGVERVDETGAVRDRLSEPFDRRRLRSSNFIDTSAIVVRSGRWCRFSRMPRRFGDVTVEDWELVWRVSRRHQVVHVPETTVRYAVHDGSYFTDR